MEMKYELLKENFKDILGHRIYQIRALKDFSNIKKGTLGGWIEKVENLSQEGRCWVFGDAQIFGDAWVAGNAQIFGNARVYDNAWVFGNACVYDNAKVYGDARVYDDVQVFGNACVYGDVQVSGTAQVYDDAHVFGTAQVFDDAWVSGTAQVFGNARVYSNARVFSNARISKSVHITKTNDYIIHGPIGSRDAFLTIIKKDNYVATGCFVGTKEEFLVQLEKTHGDNVYRIRYKIVVEMIFSLE